MQWNLTVSILQESSLEQLTFVGKKSVPSELRPDMWSCLAVVTFPTQHQGREAFRQLREFRMMHEYCWEKPEQGASLPKKSERVRMLQNQKANSIADLAAVLELQNKKGEEQREDWKAFWEEQDKRVAKLERIAGGLLQPKLEGREKLIEGLKRRRGRETENQQLRTDEQIKRLEKEKAALQAQISNAKRELARRKAVEDRVQMTVSEEAEALEVGKSEEPGMFIRQMLRHKKLAELVTRYRPLPKRGPERIRTLRELHPERVPVLWMEGVHVLWADASDADYAESWPEEMEHGEMGYMYRKASHPEAIRNIWRKERTGALLAKKSEGKQLTKEEEEFMKNVQLDGEDSGQGEDDGKRNEKRKAPDSEKEKTEMEKRRQEEEKKSIWSRIGGMFSGSKPQDRASV